MTLALSDCHFDPREKSHRDCRATQNLTYQSREVYLKLPRILFVHGLEGSPQGRKARLFERHFDAHTPWMDTRDFDACVRQQADALASYRPDLLVGSSFGGAVVVTLLEQGLWTGPTLLLAPAALRLCPISRLAENVPVTIVHGRGDTVIDIEDSRKLARTGTPGWVRLFEVDDAHDLGALVESGRLVDIARDAYTWAHTLIEKAATK
jgi:alpha-beta hydrolase superfamily lysophospholipase